MNSKFFITFIILIFCIVLYSENIKDELKPGAYILLYNGNTSYSAVIKVIVKMEEKNIKILVPEPYNVSKLLKYNKNGIYAMNINDPMGNGKVVGKIISNTEFSGKFNIQFSSEAKKRFFTNKDETGKFKLIHFSEKKFKQLKKEINDRLYNVKKYKSLEEMAKVSPYGRQLLARQKKAKSLPRKTFYGRVVDQYNAPVVGAKVEIRVADTTAIVLTYTDWPSKIYFCTTDQNGCFSLNNMKGGYCPTIKNVEKKGYTDILGHYIALSLWKDKYTIPTEPLIVNVRKKGANPTYLIQNEDFDMKIKANTEQFYSFIDLEQTWEDAGRNRDYKKDFLPKHYDIKISTIVNKSKSKWNMIFTTSAKNGGFILSNDFLSEAPQDGYKNELKIQYIAEDKQIKTPKGIKNLEELEGKFLYIKSRDPAIYTRMKITDAYMSSKGVIINTSTATNPYGKRNLEYNDELPYQITGKYKQDVLKAFLKGKLPIKPNIKKMMNKFKQSHKRIKNKYGRYQWMKK